MSLLNSILRLGPFKPPHLENLHVESVSDTLDSIITSIPEIHLNHPLASSLGPPFSLEKSKVKYHYNLRAREKKIVPLGFVGGLGVHPILVGP